MIDTLKKNRAELKELCRRYRVRRLDVFGSAATSRGFDPQRSDLDFLVEFEPGQYGLTLFAHDDLKRVDRNGWRIYVVIIIAAASTRHGEG